mgnify:CR=1 FL=1
MSQRNEAYRRDETITLPAGTSDRFYVFVSVDFEAAVFENANESNNVARHDSSIDVMPVQHADLVVSDIAVPLPVNAGSATTIAWTVRNTGPGITNRGDWVDLVYLSTDAAGNAPVDGTETRYQHFGQVAPEGDYVRTAELWIPDGLEGEHYVIVHAAESDGPFEFIFGDNNATASAAFPITLLPAPDLIVQSVVAPTTATEGGLIDVQWTVENDGEGDARTAALGGGWTDRVY